MKIHSLLIGALAITVLHAQEKPADPYRKTNEADTVFSDAGAPKNISICWETFSVPLAMAAKLQREQLPDSELYTRLVAAVEKQTVRQETFTVLRAMSGQKATAEAISEQIYPTEFIPTARTGSAVSFPAKGEPNPEVIERTNPLPTPTAFDTRNTGITLEIEPTLQEDEKFLGLRLVPEIVTMVGRSAWGQGISTTEMPVFESQRSNTSATLQINRPYLLSTLNRPPISKADPDAADRVWFGFITATLVKP